MKRCMMCGDKFTGEEINEWWAEHEEFPAHPLICPDCYDRTRKHKDLEEQFEDLMKEGT